MRIVLIFIIILLYSYSGFSQDIINNVYPGANEKTPSMSQYFSWINNTNEGSTEKQSLINLEFFKWMFDEYGMVLDIYVISAGAIDKAFWYGSMDSDEFRQQFPGGFDNIYKLAKSIGTRLGTWGGPDGFGKTPQEEKARIDMMVSLCRDYEFVLLKFDAVVGQLRNQKQESFIRMMTECRKYSPDLILLNHRLNLGEEAEKHATTYLLGGAETYIDVHMPNNQTAPHNRAAAISREVVPGFIRLTEDHGVCLSSCLDYWEDDLVLQAFNRNLLLAPQLYGNPWFLKDEEYPKLARIFNLARKYREILINGFLLPQESYGEKAVSRGDKKTRLITLRNLNWEPVRYKIKLDEEIGLESGNKFELRQYFPYEKIFGTFNKGEIVEVEVMPFRSCLIMAGQAKTKEIGIKGCDYEIVKDIKGKPVEIQLLGIPGEGVTIELEKGERVFSNAKIDGENIINISDGKKVKIDFPGKKWEYPYHRKIGELKSVELPEDAESLYEATCFAADNNALEIRSLKRSGPTQILAVQNARDAFIDQKLFSDRGLWDRYMFDGDINSSFYIAERVGVKPISGGSLRIDFGEEISVDKLIINVKDEYSLQAYKSQEAVRAYISNNLEDWKEVVFLAGKKMEINLNVENRIRYIRLNGTPSRIFEINAFLKGKKLNRSKWRGSNLFARYSRIRAEKAWEYSFSLDEIPSGSYLAIALQGKHGIEGAYAAIRVNGKAVGAPDRSVSYISNTWEYPVRKKDSNYTYYIPLTEDMVGKKIDAVVLGMKNGISEFKPEVWITAYPIPFVKKKLVLFE